MGHSRHFRKVLAGVIVITLVLGILTFVYSRAHNLIVGPVITLTEPRDSALRKSPVLFLRGTVKNAAAVHLNGRKIFLNDRMEFTETLILSEGYNIIHLTAEDRFGRTSERTIETVLAPDTTETTSEDHL